MIIALIIAFLSLIALMIIHEFGHFIIAKKFGVKVEEFGIGYPPRIFAKKFGETLYSVNAVPLGAFVRIYGEEKEIDDYRSFSGLAIWRRILIVLGGVLAFWLASMVIFSVVFLTGASIPIGDQDVAGVQATSVAISHVEKNSPAQLAGLQIGDEIISASSEGQQEDIRKIGQFQAFVEAHKGKKIVLTVRRGPETMPVNLFARVTYPQDQGPTGVELERVATIIEKHSVWEAPFLGIAYTGRVTWEAMQGIYSVLASLVGGRGVPQGAELAGPVGITIFLSQAANYGTGFFLYFIGSLSVLLALFNLLPIPALDGGKLLFLILEKVKRRPVSVRIEQSLTVFFFILLIGISLFVTVRFDIPRVMDLWRAGT